MGGNYEEVNMETEKAIFTYMTMFPMEAKKSMKLGGVSHTILIASPSQNFEKIIEDSIIFDAHPHITIDS